MLASPPVNSLTPFPVRNRHTLRTFGIEILLVLPPPVWLAVHAIRGACSPWLYRAGAVGGGHHGLGLVSVSGHIAPAHRISDLDPQSGASGPCALRTENARYGVTGEQGYEVAGIEQALSRLKT